MQTRFTYRRRRSLESPRAYLLLGIGYAFLIALTVIGMTLVFA